MKQAIRNIGTAQLCLYVGLVACVLIRPQGLSTNDGISYFGIFRETFIPYAFGLLGAAFYTWRAMGQLPQQEKVLRAMLKVYVPLIIGLVLTPYATGNWVDYVHTVCASALFSLQLVLSAWLAKRMGLPWWSLLLILVEVGSGLLSAIYLSPTHGFLFQAQVVFQMAFGALLILGLQTLDGHRPSAGKILTVWKKSDY